MEHHALDRQSPDLVEVIDHLIDSTWKSKPESGYRAATAQVVDNTVLFDLMALAADAPGATLGQQLYAVRRRAKLFVRAAREKSAGLRARRASHHRLQLLGRELPPLPEGAGVGVHDGVNVRRHGRFELGEGRLAAG